MKKILSILIAVSILLSLALPATAMAGTGAVENPVYSGSGITAPLKGGNLIFIEDSVSGVYNGKTYYSKGRQLYQYARKKLNERKQHFNLYCLSKSELNIYSAMNNIVQMVFLGATDDELSETSTDGDYLRWAVKSYQVLTVTKNHRKNNYYYYTLKVEFLYYDTLAQEQQVNGAVNSFIASLNTNGKTDVEIIKAVHDYLCHLNQYDYSALENPYKHLYAFSSYGALLKGKCVCQGYASAFYRICKELGYKVRFVSSDPDWGCHAWNIIQLDNKYYIVDCTWDDQAMDEADTGIEPYFYFLTDYATSRENDSVLGEHKLYSSLYENNYFEENYKNYFAEKPYAKTERKKLSSCTVTLSDTAYTYNGSALTPGVTVYDGKTALNDGKDYTVSYTANKMPGLATVSITGTGDYSGLSTHRCFVIAPRTAERVKASADSASAVTLRWSAAEGVSGYAVQQYSGGKWTTVTTTASTAATLADLKPATAGKFRVLPYKTVYKRNIYAQNGKTVITATKPKKASVLKLTPGKKRVSVKWKKVKGSGYQLQYSTDKSFKKAKTVKVKGKTVSKTLKKLKSGKKYYVRVRALKTFTNENGDTVTVYGKWSAKKSFITK